MKTIIQKQSDAAALVAMALVVSFVISISVFAHGEIGMEESSMHRSAISNLANELNKIANRDGGIGKELSEVAKEQNESKEKVAESMDEVENRSGFKTFLIGTDYKNLGALRSEMVTTGNHIDRLMKAKERAVNPATATDLEEQIAALQAEKTKIDNFIEENEGKFSLLGWFVKLFSR